MKNNKVILPVILLVFISLGIPDGVLGAAWPNIYTSLSIPDGMLGLISAFSLLFSLLSSLSYPKISKIFNFKQIIITSITIIIVASLIFSITTNIYTLLIGAACLGLGAGSIDTSVNDYAAKKFSVGVLNLLHGCWGIGISSGSFVVASVFYFGFNFHYAYIIVALIQAIILLIFVIFKENFAFETTSEDATTVDVEITKSDYLGSVFYFFYGVEFIIGLYLANFIVQTFDTTTYIASAIVGLYWSGLTVGRFFVLFSSKILSNFQIMASSLILAIIAALLLVLTPDLNIAYYAAAALGFAFAPLYPTMISQTASRNSKEKSSKLISMQVSAALFGVLILPTIVGFLISQFSYLSFKIFVIFSIVMLILTIAAIEIKWRSTQKRKTI